MDDSHFGFKKKNPLKNPLKSMSVFLKENLKQSHP
jgi:hypothetical protein